MSRRRIIIPGDREYALKPNFLMQLGQTCHWRKFWSSRLIGVWSMPLYIWFATIRE
jgi:hypothetical protein